MFLNWLNDVVAERAYSRKLEQEADHVGLEILALAGYDPRAMLDLWELLAAVEAEAEASGRGKSLEQRFQLLRTHPTSQARQEAIAKNLPKAMKLWTEARAPKRATIEMIFEQKKKGMRAGLGGGVRAVAVEKELAAPTAAAGATTEPATVEATSPATTQAQVEVQSELEEAESETEREV